MPRKVSSEIMGIMRPWDVENYEIYQEAKRLYKEQTKVFKEAQDTYYKQMEHLQRIIEPHLNDTYDYITSLTDDDIAEKTPQEIYTLSQTRVSMHKFGRMMREIGYKRTTTATPNGTEARWRRT